MDDENGNLEDEVGSHDSTLESMTSDGTLTELDDVTVSDSSDFVIDPHRTLSVSDVAVLVALSGFLTVCVRCNEML